ncbi:hypothetical protein L208DRAFT_1161805, partial [Tricholoma matsutake]
VYTADSTLPCPDCSKEVHVSTGSSKNLETHCTSSKACKARHEQNLKAVMTQTKKKKKQDGSLLIYFVHQQAFVPSMVITPPPVQIQQTHVSISQPPMSRGDSQLASHMILAPTDNLAHPSASCALVKRLLEQLHVSMEAIPQTLPHAGEEHPLAIFSGNPASSIGIDMDDWEDTLNPMVHHAFGYG